MSSIKRQEETKQPLKKTKTKTKTKSKLSVPAPAPALESEASRALHPPHDRGHDDVYDDKEEDASVLQPFKLDVEATVQPNVRDLVSDAGVQRAVAVTKANQAISDEEFQDRVGPYLQSRETLSSGFGGYSRQRLRKPSAIHLAQKNARFLVGVARLLLNDDQAGLLSLDLFTLPEFFKRVMDVFDGRKCRGQRRLEFSLLLT